MNVQTPLSNCLHRMWRRRAGSVLSDGTCLRACLCACVLTLSAVSWCPLGEAQQKQAAAKVDLSEATSLLQQHRLHEAKTAVLDQLKLHSSSVEGYNLLGIIEGEQQDYQGALAAFQKALALAPRSVKTHNNLGSLFAEAKQFNLAEQEFRAALRIDPADQDGNYNLGTLLMMNGDAAQAIPHFERIHPPTVAARFNLVRAYFATKRVADGLRAANELSEQARDQVPVHFSLGVFLASQKQYAQAQLELERADALQPGTFEILYNLGEVYLRMGQTAKADLALNRALKLRPDSVDSLSLLAQSYTAESRPLDALDVLLRAHKLAPENPDVIYQMAQVSMSQNYFEDAIPLLEDGLKFAPNRADMLAALGESYFMAGKVDKAIEEFNKLVAVEGSARSYAFLGLSYRNLGRFDEAKSYFEKGLKLDPKNALCLFNMGYIAERQGDAADAESYFQQTLNTNPNFQDALLEMANLKIVARRFAEAEPFLRRYVQVSHDPASGYYKLAMVERSLHETEAAERDLNVFKTLSKNASSGPYPYEHLFDYLNNRSALTPSARNELDLNQLLDEVKRHPDQPEDLYLLSKAYLKLGRMDEAKATIQQLDQMSEHDYRTLTGTGVLLASFGLYADAIAHFQRALAINPNADDIKFDLANAYFRQRSYAQALEIAKTTSDAAQKDDAYLALLGDIYAHLGEMDSAMHIYQDAIARNPDNDQAYLSLALLELRGGNLAEAQQILKKGQARIPASGKLFWGAGLTAALAGQADEAARDFNRSIELLPEWPGAYSTLGVFYFQTGQIGKAREVLDRFKDSSAHASLEVSQIEAVLDRASSSPSQAAHAMTAEDKSQLLQLAVSLADRTL
ncbi:MAG: tetratricopeptide repeat protein [Terracidiphilus sp.]